MAEVECVDTFLPLCWSQNRRCPHCEGVILVEDLWTLSCPLRGPLRLERLEPPSAERLHQRFVPDSNHQNTSALPASSRPGLRAPPQVEGGAASVGPAPPSTATTSLTGGGCSPTQSLTSVHLLLPPEALVH